jgi:hypothetical protein
MTLAKVGTNRNALATLASGMLSLRRPGQMLPVKDIARAAGQPLAALRPKINADLRGRISGGNATVIPVWGRTRTGAVRLDGIMLSTSKLALPMLAANQDRELHLADNHLTRAGVYSETQRSI